MEGSSTRGGHSPSQSGEEGRQSGLAELQARIEALVDEEHALWHEAEGRGLDSRRHERLGFIQQELDRYWDALRRRRVNPSGPLHPANVPTPPNDLEGPEPEPLHLELGSPRPANDPSPDPGINPRVP
jgi:hypothetical protein